MPFTTSCFAQSGRFTDIRPIGRGACGQVYTARDNLGRTVAVKEALPSDEEFAWVRSKFQKEARIQAALPHPNIIAIYSLEEDPGTRELYLVCEYANGGALADHLAAAGCVPESQAITIARDMCAALEATWRQMIVHRDIKPSNILLIKDTQGQIAGAKLGDFGVAQDQKLRRTTLLPGVGHPGTPLYMPPEQGNIATVLDVRSDLYALGVTLWEMQVGRDLKLLPALGETADLQAHHPRMSPGMAAVIWRATREDRDQRYESPQEMANELMAVRDGIWTPSRATIVLPRSARSPAMQSAAIERAPRRIRTVAALAALLTVAVLAAAILVIIPLSSKLGGAVTTSLAQPEPVGKSDRVISVNQQAEKVAPVCLKQQLAFAQTPPITVGAPAADILPSQDFVKGVTQLARWDAQSQVEHLAYAPDAQTFATALADGTVQLWPASGGKPLRTLCMPFMSDSTIVRVAFAADGSTIAAASGNRALHIWDVRSGTLTRKADVPTKGFSVVNMAFAPDGRTLAVSLGQGATILIVRVVDGQVLSAIDDKSGGAETLAFAPDGRNLAVGWMDGSVQLWQVSDGALLFSSHTRIQGTPELAFAPDGRTLAVAEVDGSVQLLQISDGTLLRTLGRPTQIPARATFAPDGQILAVAGWDGSVQLFQISDGALLRTLDGGPTKGRPNLAFAPDGKTLVATWEAGTIAIWGLPAKPGA